MESMNSNLDTCSRNSIPEAHKFSNKGNTLTKHVHKISDKGNALNTHKGRSTALTNFDIFLETVGKKFDFMERVEFNEELIFEYSTWLVNTFVSQTNQLLMMQSSTQYIGRVMNEIRTKFNGSYDEYFFAGLSKYASLDHWYKKMIRHVESNIARRCIDEGTKITGNPPVIGRNDIHKIASAYFLHGTPESLLRRLVICLIYVVCGRCGEAATANWSLTHWCPIYSNLYFDWSQSKNVKQKGIGILGEYEFNEMDVYKFTALHRSVGLFSLN